MNGFNHDTEVQQQSGLYAESKFASIKTIIHSLKCDIHIEHKTDAV